MFKLVRKRPFGPLITILLIVGGMSVVLAQVTQSGRGTRFFARLSHLPIGELPMKRKLPSTTRRQDLLLERLEDRVLFDAVPLDPSLNPTNSETVVPLSGTQTSETQSLVQSAPLNQGGDVSIVLNTPDTYEQALQGTGLPIRPVAEGPLIDAGTATAVRGLSNLVGPYLGSAPDAGAIENGLGLPWMGTRSYADLLAYGLPSGWRVGSMSELANFSSLGAPANVAANDFRLLLVRDEPAQAPSFLLVTFESLQGEARWSRFNAIQAGQAGDQVVVAPVQFRDGLGASIVTRGANSHLLGARVDDEGVLKVFGSVASGSLSQVQDSMFTFVRSLYYASYLQNPVQPKISLQLVAAPTPGVVTVGNPAADSTGNATVAGQLRGDVTLTSASINWDISGDANNNVTARLMFRRQGTTEWRDALDLNRINYTDHHTGKSTHVLSGSIFYLSPGTTYDVKAILTDADGGNSTLQTTFTTRTMPKIVNPGAVIEVRDTDNLDAKLAAARPGDTLLFHAGNYTSQANGSLVVMSSTGTRENPILLRAYGDGAVNFTSVMIQASHVWLDGLTVTQEVPTANGPILSGIRAIPVNNQFFTGVTLTRNTVKNANYVINADANEFLILDNYVIGADRKVSQEGIEFDKLTRGHVAAFNDITAVYDGISYGQGNIDIHNNSIHNIGDNSIEPDYAWDNYRVWENRSWDVGQDDISFQPMNGGPWYIVRNQLTGAKFNSFKLRSGDGPKFIVGNTVVSPNSTLNSHYFFNGGGIFANNYWKALSWNGGVNDSLGGGSGDPQAAKMTLWGYNRYDAHPNNVWGFYGGTLAGLQANGAEIGSAIVNRDNTVVATPPPTSNGTPVASAQSLVARQDTAVQIQLVGSDPNKDPITYALAGAGPAHGTLSDFDPIKGTVTYTPHEGYVGNDSFTFNVSDGKTASGNATVSLRTIVPVPIDQQGLVGNWRLDETTGTTVVDSSGQNNHGTLLEGPVWTSGKIGGGLALDGVNDRVTIPDRNSLDVTGPITISLWVKSSGLVNNNGGFVSKSSDSTKYGAAAQNTVYEFGVNFGQLYFTISDGTTMSTVSGDELPVIDGAWHHLTAVWDGTTNAGGLKIYLDAVETYTSTSAISRIQSRDWKLDLGGAGQKPFAGAMDDVSIFNRALTQGEILTLASGRAASNTPEITSVGVDVDRSADPGNQVYAGDPLKLSAQVVDPDQGPLTYTWSYRKDNGPEVLFAQGAAPIPQVSFNTPTDAVGSTYHWTLAVSDGVDTVTKSLDFTVLMPPLAPPVLGPPSEALPIATDPTPVPEPTEDPTVEQPATSEDVPTTPDANEPAAPDVNEPSSPTDETPISEPTSPEVVPEPDVVTQPEPTPEPAPEPEPVISPAPSQPKPGKGNAGGGKSVLRLGSVSTLTATTSQPQFDAIMLDPGRVLLSGHVSPALRSQMTSFDIRVNDARGAVVADLPVSLNGVGRFQVDRTFGLSGDYSAQLRGWWGNGQVVELRTLKFHVRNESQSETEPAPPTATVIGPTVAELDVAPAQPVTPAPPAVKLPSLGLMGLFIGRR